MVDAQSLKRARILSALRTARKCRTGLARTSAHARERQLARERAAVGPPLLLLRGLWASRPELDPPPPRLALSAAGILAAPC